MVAPAIVAALLVVVATVALFTFFVIQTGATNPAINQAQKEIILYILGVLSAAVTQILGYYFGSSQGSAAKDKSIANIALQSKAAGDTQ